MRLDDAMRRLWQFVTWPFRALWTFWMLSLWLPYKASREDSFWIGTVLHAGNGSKFVVIEATGTTLTVRGLKHGCLTAGTGDVSVSGDAWGL